MIKEVVLRAEMQEKIENYILGRLTQDEIDELWMKILKAPEWLGILEVEVNLSLLIRSRRILNSD